MYFMIYPERSLFRSPVGSAYARPSYKLLEKNCVFGSLSIHNKKLHRLSYNIRHIGLINFGYSFFIFRSIDPLTPFIGKKESHFNFSSLISCSYTLEYIGMLHIF